MTKFTLREKMLNIQLETKDLSQAQIRLVKTLNTLLMEVLTTQKEASFFETSAELVRLCASVIQQSNFTLERAKNTDLPYATQALEYSVDILQDHMSTSKVVKYDN